MQLMDSHVAAGQELPPKDRQAYYGAVVEYLATGQELPLKGAAKAVFVAIKPTLDNSRARSSAGSVGGSKSHSNIESKVQANVQAKVQANVQAKGKANARANGQANRNRNRKEDADASSKPQTPFAEEVSDESCGTSDAKDAASFSAACLAAWNEETGQDVRAFAGTVYPLIETVRRSGRTVQDVRKVVRLKRSQWEGSPKMRRWLRPSTIFKKFEEYAAEAAGEETSNAHDWGSASRVGDTDQPVPC